MGKVGLGIAHLVQQWSPHGWNARGWRAVWWETITYGSEGRYGTRQSTDPTIYSADLPEYSRPNENLNDITSIINTFYFPAWLVGFIEAEGCFSIYKQNGDYPVASFDISQTDGDVIISAIREYLSFTTSIYVDKNNTSRLKVSSVRSIENVIKFINNAPVKLLGNKKLQYLLWIKQLRRLDRYSKKINIPSNY